MNMEHPRRAPTWAAIRRNKVFDACSRVCCNIGASSAYLYMKVFFFWTPTASVTLPPNCNLVLNDALFSWSFFMIMNSDGNSSDTKKSYRETVERWKCTIKLMETRTQNKGKCKTTQSIGQREKDNDYTKQNRRRNIKTRRCSWSRIHPGEYGASLRASKMEKKER